MLLCLIDLNVSVVQVVTDAESAGVRWSDDENFGDAEVRKEGGVFCFPFVFLLQTSGFNYWPFSIFRRVGIEHRSANAMGVVV